MTNQTSPKAYFFISRPVDLKIANEGVSVVLANNFQEAALHAVQLIPPGYSIKFLAERSQEELRQLFMIPDRQEEKPIPTTISREGKPADPIKMSKDSFKNSILLVADDYIKDKEDQEKLKEIIKKANL